MSSEIWSQAEYLAWLEDEKKKEKQAKRRSKAASKGQGEHSEQAAVIAWAWSGYALDRWPDLVLLHAIPNGGHRHVQVAVKMKAEGVQAGVPDLSLPVPRGVYHGMYIELKYGSNKASQAQIKWLNALGEKGYKAVICWGAQEAKYEIMAYMLLGEYTG